MGKKRIGNDCFVWRHLTNDRNWVKKTHATQLEVHCFLFNLRRSHIFCCWIQLTFSSANIQKWFLIRGHSTLYTYEQTENFFFFQRCIRLYKKGEENTFKLLQRVLRSNPKNACPRLRKRTHKICTNGFFTRKYDFSATNTDKGGRSHSHLAGLHFHSQAVFSSNESFKIKCRTVISFRKFLIALKINSDLFSKLSSKENEA